MKKSGIIILFILQLILFSCEPAVNSKNVTINRQHTENGEKRMIPIPADYKIVEYNISIGDNYRTSDRLIDWQWAALADDDGRIDSTGKDAFLNLGEPLIRYNDANYQPTLFIETDKNIITSFSCSVLFDLEDTPNSKEVFLNLLSENIGKLNVDTIKKQIISNGKFENMTDHYSETIELKKGDDFDFDRFEYRIAYQNK